jgi:hypothetical protein
VTQVSPDFWDGFQTGSESSFLSPKGEDLALLDLDDALYQPFMEDTSEVTAFDTQAGIDLASFQINLDLPTFNDQYASGDPGIFYENQEELVTSDPETFAYDQNQEELVAWNPGFEVFYPLG